MKKIKQVIIIYDDKSMKGYYNKKGYDRIDIRFIKEKKKDLNS